MPNIIPEKQKRKDRERVGAIFFSGREDIRVTTIAKELNMGVSKVHKIIDSIFESRKKSYE